MLPIDRQGLLHHRHRLPETPLSPPEGRLQVDHLGPDELVPRHAADKERFRFPESRLGAPQLTQNPLSISQIGIRPRPKVQDPVRVISVSESLRHLDAQLGEVDGPARVLECRFQALLEQQLADAPDLKGLIVGDQAELLVEREVTEPSESLRSLRPFNDSHALIPMADLFLKSQDLFVSLVALRAPLKEMRNPLGKKLFMAEIAGHQLRQRFNGWMTQGYLPRFDIKRSL